MYKWNNHMYKYKDITMNVRNPLKSSKTCTREKVAAIWAVAQSVKNKQEEARDPF